MFLVRKSTKLGFSRKMLINTHWCLTSFISIFLLHFAQIRSKFEFCDPVFQKTQKRKVSKSLVIYWLFQWLPTTCLIWINCVSIFFLTQHIVLLSKKGAFFNCSLFFIFHSIKRITSTALICFYLRIFYKLNF